MPPSQMPRCCAFRPVPIPSEDWSWVYHQVIQPVAEEKGYECTPGRVLGERGTSIQQVVSALIETDVVIFDTTGYGARTLDPRVLYQIGIRHTASSRSILIAAVEADIPAEFNTYLTVPYHKGHAGEFRDQLRSAFDDMHQQGDARIDNPVHSHLSTSGRVTLDSPRQEPDLRRRFEELEDLVRTIVESRTTPPASQRIRFTRVDRDERAQATHE